MDRSSKKQAIIDELKDEGVLLDAVREELGKTELDDFDLICHLAYDKPPLTKAERANNVKNVIIFISILNWHSKY